MVMGVGGDERQMMSSGAARRMPYAQLEEGGMRFQLVELPYGSGKRFAAALLVPEAEVCVGAAQVQVLSGPGFGCSGFGGPRKHRFQRIAPASQECFKKICEFLPTAPPDFPSSSQKSRSFPGPIWYWLGRN